MSELFRPRPMAILPPTSAFAELRLITECLGRTIRPARPDPGGPSGFVQPVSDDLIRHISARILAFSRLIQHNTAVVRFLALFIFCERSVPSEQSLRRNIWRNPARIQRQQPVNLGICPAIRQLDHPGCVRVDCAFERPITYGVGVHGATSLWRLPRSKMRPPSRFRSELSMMDAWCLQLFRLLKQGLGPFPGFRPTLGIAPIHPDALGGFSALSRLLRLKDREGIAIHVGRKGGGAHG